MTDHGVDPLTILKARIAERLQELDLTERSASMAATGQPDTLRYIRTRNTMPSPPKLVAIASVLQCSIGYLLGSESASAGANPGEPDYALTVQRATAPVSRFIPVKKAIAPVPLDQLSEGIKFPGSLMAINGHAVVDQIMRPPALSEHRDIYCFYNPIWEMDPVIEAGTPVVVDADRPPINGDFALVFLRPSPDGIFGLCILRRLLARTEKAVTLQHYAPDTTFELPVAHVLGLQKILTMADVLGA
jgi:hypothetical protein